MDIEVIKLTKLEVARRQLDTAIRLWFADGEPVSIHSLAYAAYEIIHVVSKIKNPNRQDLLFDSLQIADEIRGEFNHLMKKDANFFKHAKKDHSLETEFHPMLSDMFILFAIFGIELAGEKLNVSESAFMFWLYIHKAETLSAEGRKRFIEDISVDYLSSLKSIPKHDFLHMIYLGGKAAGKWD
jgi:hypothetical protein